MTAERARPGDNRRTLDDWAKRINTQWGKSVAAVVETGMMLLEAKRELGRGNWEKLFRDRLGGGLVHFDIRTAQMMMRVAKHPTLVKTQNYAFLPQALSTLEVLTGYTDDDLQKMIDRGDVYPAMTAAEARHLFAQRASVEEFAKALAVVHDSLLKWAPPHSRPADLALDEDDLDQLAYEIGQRVPGGPRVVAESMMPLVAALMERLGERRVAREHAGSDRTERDGKLAFADDAAHAVGPMDDDLRDDARRDG